MSPGTPGPSMLSEAKRVLRAEAGAVLSMEARLGPEFDRALWAINCVRILYVTGVGKSGDVGRSVAETMASMGTPASFLHPTEAVHGSLGRVLHDDGLLAISRSGECEETLRVVRAFRARYREECTKLRPDTDQPFESHTFPPVIALTGVLDSSLAKLADVVLDCGASEVDDVPAPRASKTATQAMGHALAHCLAKRRGFTAEDFRATHPGGVLGRAG